MDGWMDERWMDGRMDDSAAIKGKHRSHFTCKNQQQLYHYLFFCLSFLYYIPPNFDTWSQDGPGEICHINSHEVTNLLSSWMEEKSILRASQKRRLRKGGPSHEIFMIYVYIGYF